MLMKPRNKQSGMTLTELMVGMAVGLIVSASIFAIYLTSIRTSSETLQASKLNQELSAIMGIMANEIRRAGYWWDINPADTTCFALDDYLLRPHSDPDLLNSGAGCVPPGPPYYNPFNTPGSTALTIRDTATDADAGATGSGNCIVFTYDLNRDGDIDNTEFMGFRRNVDGDGNETDTVSMRRRGDIAGGDAIDSCADGDWDSLNDDGVVRITGLTFDFVYHDDVNGNGVVDNNELFVTSQCINANEPNEADSPNDADILEDNPEEFDCFAVAPESGTRTSTVRVVTITLTGELVSDPAVNATLLQSVRVRNDLVTIVP